VLRRILRKYYQHIEKNPDSLITRFYGAHCIKMSHADPLYVIVMANIFNQPFKIHDTYDLKGSWIDRGGKKGRVLGQLGKDMDLQKTINIGTNLKNKLVQIIIKDTQMLRDVHIMDYSLLLGFHYLDQGSNKDLVINLFKEIDVSQEEEDLIPLEDNESKKGSNQHSLLKKNNNYQVLFSEDQKTVYVLGIIDILQAYDTQKKMERFFKVFFACKDKHGVSVQGPEYYCRRFIEQITKRIG